MRHTLLVFFIMAATAFPAGPKLKDIGNGCIELDRSGWTQNQKNRTKGAAYQLMFRAGFDIIPTLTGDILCFDPAPLDVAQIIDEVKILAVMAENDNNDITEKEAAKAAKKLLEDEAEQLTAAILADDLIWDSKTDQEKIFTLKKLLRLNVLREQGIK
jgi:hypothetical protein